MNEAFKVVTSEISDLGDAVFIEKDRLDKTRIVRCSSLLCIGTRGITVKCRSQDFIFPVIGTLLLVKTQSVLCNMHGVTDHFPFPLPHLSLVHTSLYILA